jgi:hypothetical protein
MAYNGLAILLEEKISTVHQMFPILIRLEELVCGLWLHVNYLKRKEKEKVI